MYETEKCLILNLLEQIIHFFRYDLYKKNIFFNQGASAVKLYQYTEKA